MNFPTQESNVQTNTIVEFHPSLAARIAPQGDLCIAWLTPEEATGLAGHAIRRSESGDIRLLHGEVTGHHHTILRGLGVPQPVMFRDDGLAGRTEAATLIGSAVLFEDPALLGTLPWLTRRDLAIGFLKVEGGPVLLGHPEHDAIRLPAGTYYVGRQVESAGAEERVVVD